MSENESKMDAAIDLERFSIFEMDLWLITEAKAIPALIDFLPKGL